MSKISLAPDASGTGIFTIASPNSNTNRTLTLPDDTGTIVTNSGNQAGSFTTLNTSGQVVFNDAGADVDFRVEGDTDANLLFVDASTDRVGVGTNTPTVKLHVKSDGAAIGLFESTLVAGNTNVETRYTSTNRSWGVGQNIIQTSSIFEIADVTAGATRLAIDSSGNVGIGTSAPDSKLDITGADNTGGTLASRVYSLNRSAFLGFGFNTISASSNSTGLFLESLGANIIAFDTNGTERARITSGGYFRASNTGSYQNSTGTYYEFNQSADDYVLWQNATSATFTQDQTIYSTTRSASTAYNFGRWFSGALADLEFQFRGDGNAYADGSWNGSGADYAEYFESATGEAIPRGTTVVLENNKVRSATADDPTSSIIGVVRPKEFGKGSMVIGNLAWNMWTDKYITDDFGVYEMEDHDVVEWEETITDEEGKTSTKQHSYESHAIPEGVTVPADATRKTHDENGKKFQHRKLNPNYDPAVEYTPREERPEWLIIGLLGQVPVLKGQPVGDRWVKMRDISEAVEEWMIR